MGFPNEKELKIVRAKLAKLDDLSRMLPKNASEVDKIKYKICQKFVLYLITHQVSQADLAKKLKIDPSRVNEIVKYKLELFTIDTLITLAGRLKIDLKIEVA